MKQITPFIITISRQIGSGGAYIGQKLADKLNIFYADREIIRSAAQALSVKEEDVDFRDEKAPSFWESIFQNSAYVPEAYVAQKVMPPTDQELFDAETNVIRLIAKEKSAVIIGRCGFHVLKGYPGLVNIYLHAGTDFRSERIQQLYQVSKAEAEKIIIQTDKNRRNYCKTYTQKEWSDANNYSLSIDTGLIGLDKAIEVVTEYLKIKGFIL